MGRRALVLGSGGLSGIAWEVGVLQGLNEAGVRVDGWDLMIGTSAGAYVGARLVLDGSPSPCSADDTAQGLSQILGASFERVELETVGSTAIFAATNPRRQSPINPNDAPRWRWVVGQMWTERTNRA